MWSDQTAKLLETPIGNQGFGNLQVTEWLYNYVCRRRIAESVASLEINVTTMPRPHKVLSPTAVINGWTPVSEVLAPTPTFDPSSSQPPPLNNSLSDYVGMHNGGLNGTTQRFNSQLGYHSRVSGDAKRRKAQLWGMNRDSAISPASILNSTSLQSSDALSRMGPSIPWPDLVGASFFFI